jgi:D-serine deaminase-like pyridoxal phosphate-dependent protein
MIGHPGAVIGPLSEEHGVVTLSLDDPDVKIGEQVEIIPNHICPSVNLMDELVIVRDAQVIDTWKVAARGKVR